MQASRAKTTNILLIGGGHTHALVLRQLAKRPIQTAEICLISPSSKAPYTGMLPGFVAGHYKRSDVEIDMLKLARAAGANIILDEVTQIDCTRNLALFRERPAISFDLASINIGITSNLPKLPGFNMFGHPAKPLSGFASGWETFIALCKTQKASPKISVIGGGVAGVELALAMSYRTNMELGHPPEMTIIERSSEILRGTHPKTRAKLTRHLQKANVTIRLESTPVRISKNEVELADGSTIESNFTVGAAGATPHDWISETNLETQNGFVCVDQHLRSTSHPHIFATGDCAHFRPGPLPKAGVFAVRQAPVLLKNLRASLSGARLTPYSPQKTYLKLISTGPKDAVADKFGFSWGGPLLWTWKDHIDRKFMSRLDPPHAMFEQRAKTDHPSSDQMLCGGCGAKMAGDALHQTLQNAASPKRKDVISKLGDDAAILKHGKGFQVITNDHLRSFTSDPWLMGKIAAIHALGDVWAMGASPQAALATIILPQMSDRLHTEMLNQILAGAREEIDKTGAELVGGHTSVGAELTIGFTVTGLSQKKPITNSGAKAGDTLVLTKPLGIGTILAAEMQGRADGYHVEDAYRLMRQSNAAASRILTPVAHAMTDVTGFGLAGHLKAMMTASSTRAEIDEAAIPMLDAALTYADQGTRSSIWDANRRILPDMTITTPRQVLLFDPQTSGGLLAAIPTSRAQDILAALLSEGMTAAIIGTVSKGEPGVTFG